MAVPLFSQVDPHAQGNAIEWFSLSETRAGVRQILGPPRLTVNFGDDFESWQFQIGVQDSHEFSHQFVFRKSTGKLVSATRQWEEEHNVDALFPTGTKYVHAPDSGYPVAIRTLPNGRTLLGMGISGPGGKTTQVMLIHDEEIANFLPWLTGPIK